MSRDYKRLLDCRVTPTAVRLSRNQRIHARDNRLVSLPGVTRQSSKRLESHDFSDSFPPSGLPFWNPVSSTGMIPFWGVPVRHV